MLIRHVILLRWLLLWRSQHSASHSGACLPCSCAYLQARLGGTSEVQLLPATTISGKDSGADAAIGLPSALQSLAGFGILLLPVYGQPAQAAQGLGLPAAACMPSRPCNAPPACTRPASQTHYRHSQAACTCPALQALVVHFQSCLQAPCIADNCTSFPSRLHVPCISSTCS